MDGMFSPEMMRMAQEKMAKMSPEQVEPHDQRTRRDNPLPSLPS
jgi:hypothetical protein